MNWTIKAFLGILLVTVTWLCNCGKIEDILHEDIYVLEGEMRFADVEGGCWVFFTDDESYQLVGEKAEEVKADGAEARLRVKERDDLLGWCPGTFVEVLEVLWVTKP